MSAWELAVVLSVVAALLHAVAAVFQERMAGQRRGTPVRRLGTLRMLWLPRWWWAVALTGTAAGLHVLALRFGPLTLVQPLGALTLVLALSLSAVLAGRRVTRPEWLGLMLTVVGLALLLVFTTAEGRRDALTPNEVFGLSVATSGMVAVLVVAAMRTRRQVPRSLLHAVGAGISFGVASALAQTVTVRIARSGWEEAITPAAATVIVLAFAGLLLAQAAYRAGIGAPLATLTIVNPIVAASIGLRLLDERLEAGTGGAVWIVLAALAAMGGIVILARARVATSEKAAGSMVPSN